MSLLTDEQRRRIEENRRKALEIRASKSANNTTNSVNNCGGSELKSSMLNSVNYTNSFGVNKPSNVFNATKGNKVSQNDKVTTLAKDSVGKIQSADISPSKINGLTVTDFYSTKPTVTVSCRLISRGRFTAVLSKYSKLLLELFKTIPGKLYDPHTANWNFPLSEYNNLKKHLRDTKYNATFEGIPDYLLKVFNKSKANNSYKNIDLSEVNQNLLHSLYPFQREGVQFGVSKQGRCIIADDMGLGKTIQALGIASYYSVDWPLLIVCPSSVRYRWEQEFITYFQNTNLTKLFVMTKSKDDIGHPDVLITSYDLMARTSSTLINIEFGVVIMDESHQLKNFKTNRTKAALSIIEKAKRCVLLSGTPALSRPIELYSQIKAIEPRFMSFREFGVRYCAGRQLSFGWDFSGSSNMEELKLLLEERFMIRRLKTSVLDQLPSKVREVVILDSDKIKIEKKVMSVFTEKLNTADVKGMQKRGTLLSYFAETAKIKIDAVKDYLNQLLEGGHKFLVFAHHREMLDAICTMLEDKQTYYIRIDGATDSEERKSVCDQFQFEDKFRVAVLSITAASTGLTLTAAHLVVFAELFWNPGILTQAEDRVHRIGQQDSVLIQYLIARNTADDYLWPMIQSKLNILNQAGLSKDNFMCEDTSVKQESHQSSILDFFETFNGSTEDTDEYLCIAIDNVEKGQHNKRLKLDEQASGT